MGATLQGQRAPDFSLPGSDGKVHSLAEYAGKILVLYFYPKDNTPGCSKEACSFRDLHKEFEDAGAVVLGISKDSLAAHDRFIAKFGLPFVLLTDPDADVLTRYNAYGEKTLYGKKTVGTIRSTVVIGPDGAILRHWPKVGKAEAHPQEVLEFLKSL